MFYILFSQSLHQSHLILVFDANQEQDTELQTILCQGQQASVPPDVCTKVDILP